MTSLPYGVETLRGQFSPHERYRRFLLFFFLWEEKGIFVSFGRWTEDYVFLLFLLSDRNQSSLETKGEGSSLNLSSLWVETLRGELRLVLVLEAGTQDPQGSTMRTCRA